MINVLWISSKNCRVCISFCDEWKQLVMKYNKISFRKIYVEEEPDTIRQYNIIYYPTFLFFQDETLFEKRVIGADKKELEAELVILHDMA